MKADLLEIIRAELRSQLDRLTRAAAAAHAAATDPGSKAESKYDTRSLEESYLATGQARQVKELAASLQAFDNVKSRDYAPGDEIDSGALVKTKRKGEKKLSYFFLAPSAGGLEVMLGKKEVTLLSPESPLYQNLLGKTVGDLLEFPPLEISQVT